MMSKGISEPWPDILSNLTDGRQNSLDPSSILEYFRPLNDWLLKQNLTVSEWDCDSFVDSENSIVKSYDGLSPVSSVSATMVTLNTDFYCFYFGFFVFFSWNFSRHI